MVEGIKEEPVEDDETSETPPQQRDEGGAGVAFAAPFVRVKVEPEPPIDSANDNDDSNSNGGSEEGKRGRVRIVMKRKPRNDNVNNNGPRSGTSSSSVQNGGQGSVAPPIMIKREPNSDIRNGRAQASVETQPSFLRWNRKALIGKMGSVVQTVLNRQLGIPFFSRSEESACNNFNEMQIGRQLISKRTRSAEDHGAKPMKPSMVKVKDKRKHTTSSKVTTDWVQMEIPSPEKTDVSLADTRLWTRFKEGPGKNARYKEQFFAVDAYNFEFSLISQLHSRGKGAKKCLLEGRTLSSDPYYTYLLTLSEPNYLRAYDMVKKKIAGELTLSLDITTPTLKGYTDLDVCDPTRKIFVMGTAEKKHVKVILILDYPPSWSKVGIIYVDPLQFKLNNNDGLCCILQDKKLHLSTWPFLMENVKKIVPSTGKSPAPSLSVKFEGRISEMPKLINTIHLETEYFGLLDVETPLIYALVKKRMKLFHPVHLNSGGAPEPVYEFKNGGMGDQADSTAVFQFPDNSPRALICNQLSNQYEVVNFKFERMTGSKTMNTFVTHPFNYWEELKVKCNAERTNASTSRRPKRSCVNIVKTSVERKSILGITYNSLLDLIAVLIADEEEFMVIIYDPFKLSVFKALPPVRAWPPVKGGDPNKKRESIQSVDFCFEPDFIFVEFAYSSECKPPKEIFAFRLMSESE